MTLEEKANMLVGYSFGKSYWGLPTNPDRSEERRVGKEC